MTKPSGTRSTDGKKAIAAQVRKDKSMSGEAGHILHHIYRTMAERPGILRSRARALLDHKQPGLDDPCLHWNALREELPAGQERIKADILETADAFDPFD